MTLSIQFTGQEDQVDEEANQVIPATSVATQAPGGSPAILNPTTQAPPHPSGLTQFEKAEVSKSVIKIAGTVTVDTHDEIVVSLDDRLRVVGEFRVVRVNHVVNPKDGTIVREQVISLVTDSQLQLCPWDPSDPTDEGIVRMRP